MRKLKVLRMRRGMTQRVLAEKVGISREYLARLEAGQHDPPLSTLMTLAKALRVKAGKLLE